MSAMRSDRLVTSVDFHTAGIGMRLVTAGVPRVPGATIAEKRRYFEKHLDHLRTGLCFEPRGHRGLLIAVLVDPVTPGAAFGLLFMYPGGYYVSCGEGTIGAATIAVATGMVSRVGETTRQADDFGMIGRVAQLVVVLLEHRSVLADAMRQELFDQLHHRRALAGERRKVVE